jgi:hypothetical protein
LHAFLGKETLLIKDVQQCETWKHDDLSVTTASGSVLSADYLVVAAGAQANFFGTPGAPGHALPPYSVNYAGRLRARILDVLDATVLSDTRNKIDAFIAWRWDYFSNEGVTAIVDRPDAVGINWEDDDQGERPEFDSGPMTTDEVRGVTRPG